MSERGGRVCWAGRANGQHGLQGLITFESQIPMREWYLELTILTVPLNTTSVQSKNPTLWLGFGP